MSALSDLIKARMAELGLTQEQIAQEMGIRQASVSALCSGDSKSTRYPVELARVLQVPVSVVSDANRGVRSWLGQAIHGVNHHPDHANVMPGPPLRGRVPLISWVQAGHAKEAIDLWEPGQAEEWVETTAQVRRHTYALRVEGDSMIPDFPPGTLIVVEPDMDPEPGDFVIAQNGEGEATFKQLVKDGSEWFLKPLNERYPIKPLGSTRIVGVVREAIRKFR